MRILPILTFVMLINLPGMAFALRCGSDLVEIGDLKFEVLLACGEPFSKEVIGHIDQRRYTVSSEDIDSLSNDMERETIERIRVMLIEEWIIKKKKEYYSLIFEGNTLKSIEWVD